MADTTASKKMPVTKFATSATARRLAASLYAEDIDGKQAMAIINSDVPLASRPGVLRVLKQTLLDMKDLRRPKYLRYVEKRMVPACQSDEERETLRDIMSMSNFQLNKHRQDKQYRPFPNNEALTNMWLSGTKHRPFPSYFYDLKYTPEIKQHVKGKQDARLDMDVIPVSMKDTFEAVKVMNAWFAKNIPLLDGLRISDPDGEYKKLLMEGVAIMRICLGPRMPDFRDHIMSVLEDKSAGPRIYMPTASKQKHPRPIHFPSLLDPQLVVTATSHARQYFANIHKSKLTRGQDAYLKKYLEPLMPPGFFDKERNNYHTLCRTLYALIVDSRRADFAIPTGKTASWVIKSVLGHVSTATAEFYNKLRWKNDEETHDNDSSSDDSSVASKKRKAAEDINNDDRKKAHIVVEPVTFEQLQFTSLNNEKEIAEMHEVARVLWSMGS